MSAQGVRDRAKQAAKATWEVKIQKQAWAMHKMFPSQTLGQCYEEIAKARGFTTYVALRAHLKEATK